MLPSLTPISTKPRFVNVSLLFSSIVLLALVLSLNSCSKKITTLIPTWDQGRSYKYKLTYTIKSPEINRGEKGPSTVHVYQTLNVVSESAESWVVNLQFDRIIKDPTIWDQDAEYRFFPNQLHYEIDVPKSPSRGITVINSDEIYDQIIAFVKDNMDKEALDQLIKETKERGGIEDLVLKDFGFLFLNTYNKVNYDIPVVSDSTYAKKMSKQTETFTYDKSDKHVVFNVEEIERFTPNVDTIPPFIYTYRESIATTDQKIKYNKESIPVFSEIITKMLDGGAKVTRLDKDHNTILTGGSLTETVTVKLLAVE